MPSGYGHWTGENSGGGPVVPLVITAAIMGVIIKLASSHAVERVVDVTAYVVLGVVGAACVATVAFVVRMVRRELGSGRTWRPDEAVRPVERPAVAAVRSPAAVAARPAAAIVARPQQGRSLSLAANVTSSVPGVVIERRDEAVR